MEFQQSEKLNSLADEVIKFAREYSEARQKAGKAKYELDIMLASQLEAIRKEKPNVGYDMAINMMIEPGRPHFEAIRAIYKDFLKYTSIYKGLEKLIEALQAKLSFNQSLMKYELTGH